METDYDLIIVGAGLTGNCLALALQNSGLKIAIVEASSRQALSDSPLGERALALAAGTVELLDAWGAWGNIVDKATPIKHIHVSDRGHFGKTRLSAAENAVDALGYVIIAHDIEQHIANLVEQASIDIYYETRVAGFMAGHHAINVSLKKQGKNLNLSAQLLVGADGGQSTVRKLLNIPQQITDYQQTAVVATIQSTLPHQNIAYERFTNTGPLALLPLTGKQSALVWTRSPEQAETLMDESEEYFISELQSCFGYRLGALKLVSARRAFPLSLIRAERMIAERAVLIGNAVHQLHPVAGQGFNLGIRDAAKLAEMLLAKRQNGDDIGATQLLTDYARQRQRDHDKTIGFTNQLIRLFCSDWLPIAAIRNSGLTLIDHLPNIKQLLASHAMGFTEQLSKPGSE